MMTSSSLELRNGSELKLATLKSDGFLGQSGKRLEILVPCDSFFVGLVMFSAMVARDLTKTTNETAGETAQAMVGA